MRSRMAVPPTISSRTQQEEAPRKHDADVRTALKTVFVHGQFYGLSLPDDEGLVWDGDLWWFHGNPRPGASFSYIQDYYCAWLIFTLEMNVWLSQVVPLGLVHWDFGCYLAGIFVYTGPLDKVLPFNSTQERWGTFFRKGSAHVTSYWSVTPSKPFQSWRQRRGRICQAQSQTTVFRAPSQEIPLYIFMRFWKSKFCSGNKRIS
ncbi:hypothetical protein F4604DRAFT_1902558 [Suillus subluteus]|nr:hypothetical protein F4604DRAFT_1902558 [Suillus subluteus]